MNHYMVKTSTKTFTLLSIGHRTVGKTVFLAGSYAELHSRSQTDSSQQLWFDCQNTQVQSNIEHILSYIVQTGEYPPATIKITNFDFSLKLKHHSLQNTKTLCHFCWRDIPGEYCNLRNLEFQEMAFTSHGCCVFIDAYALVRHNKAYLQVFENIIKQVMAIANLFCLNGSKYAFALILTKCDLLEPGSLGGQQLEADLQPLTTRLDAVKANYQTFYSFIPISRTEVASTLKPKGAAAPFLWLVWELSKAHNPSTMNNLLEFVTPLLPSPLQPQQAMVQRALQSQIKVAGTPIKKIFSLHLRLASWKYIWLMALVMVSLLGVISTFLVKEAVANYEQDRRSNTRHVDAVKQVIPLVEQRVQKEPENFELRLQLAQLYERTNQFSKAETVYNQVLSQQNNNLNALIHKANLRYLQGDNQAAKLLFAQAEKAAPPNLKARVHALAQQTLRLPAKSDTTHQSG